RVASGIVTEARGYLSNLEMPFRLVVLTPEEDVSKRSGPTKAPLAGVILLVAVSAGIATQQAAWQLAKLPPVEARPTTSPRIPHSPESDGHGGIHAPTSEELTR